MIANAREDKPLLSMAMAAGTRLALRGRLLSPIALALEKAKPGSTYNVSAGMPQPN